MDKKVKEHITIKQLPEDDRPREKLMRLGMEALSKAELIGLIIQTGSKEATAVELGRKVVTTYNNNLSAFFNKSIKEIAENEELKGIGIAKACQIKAALELGRRMQFLDKKLFKIKEPKDVANYMMDKMCYLEQEHFMILILDSKNQIRKEETITIGTINASLVHPREVFAKAIQEHAVSIILLHNHPSGDPTPSQEDIKITHRLVKVGELVGISVLDHIIIGERNFVSLKEEKIM